MGRVALRSLVVVAALGSLVASPGCGGGGSVTAPKREDGGLRDAASVVELPVRPLGLARADDFQWRRRGGQPAYRVARHAEARGEWGAVVTACHQALAADPGHLEAQWLLAAALAHMERWSEVVAPLQAAVAGDFASWGERALTHPAFARFLATPSGAAWRRRLDADRTTFAAAVAHAVVVISRGELYAVEPDGARWYQLTRTGGRVVAALAAPLAHRLAYVVRRGRQPRLGLGVVELATGVRRAPVDLGPAAPLTLGYSARAPQGFWIGLGRPRGAWRVLDGAGSLAAVTAKLATLPPPWLELAGRALTLHRVPVPDVGADWDERVLASALRLAPSGRVVEVPSPALVDGNTASWSPDHARLAFVAELDERCAPVAPPVAAPATAPRAPRPATTAIYVADAATGTVTEVARAAGGLAVEWAGEHRLAIADGRGVAIVELAAAGAARHALAGATGLTTPRHLPRCRAETDELGDGAVPEDPATVPATPGDDDPGQEEGEGDDAGTPGPPPPVQPR